MDPNEKENELVDLIAGNVSATEEEPVEDVAAAVTDELTPDDPEQEAEEVAEEVVEEEEPAEEAPTEETNADEPEKSEHDKAVDKEIADLGLKEKSSARFRELANRAKERDEFETRYKESQAVFDHMEQAGINGEQFGIMTAIASDVNSGDPIREERAYKALMAEASALAQKLGIRTEGHNPLSAHADLKTRVDEGTLDENDALELARARAMQTRTVQHHEQTSAKTQHEQVIAGARDSLTALETQLKAQDPQYAAKRAIIEPLLRAQIASGALPPDQWAPTYASMYGNVNLPSAPKAAPIVKAAPDNRARPNGTAGAPAPKSAEEAVLAALGMSPE